MTRSKFTKEQIVVILQEQSAGGDNVGDLPAASHQQRHVLRLEGEACGMQMSDARRPKALEDEDANLGRIGARKLT